MLNSINKRFCILKTLNETINFLEGAGINMESQFVRSYTIKEVSKMVNVPPGTLRQWEKDLLGLLTIPRTKQGARFYTENEIELLGKIKHMRDKNLSKDMIRELFQKHLDVNSEAGSEPFEASIALVQQKNEEASTPPLQGNAQNLDNFFEAMEVYKQNLLRDVKEEIRNGIRKEVLEDVKKEISKGSLHTVRSLSDSIYKSSEKTKGEIKELSSSIEKASEQTSETVRALSHNIVKTSKGTSEKITSLADRLSESSELTSESIKTLTRNLAKTSKGTSDKVNALFRRISETSEASSEEFKTLIHYISNSTEITNHEINSLVETLNKDREFYIDAIYKEREQLQVEIRNREEVFQDLVLSFRKTAAAEENEKSWWKFWKKNSIN